MMEKLTPRQLAAQLRRQLAVPANLVPVEYLADLKPGQGLFDAELPFMRCQYCGKPLVIVNGFPGVMAGPYPGAAHVSCFKQVEREYLESVPVNRKPRPGKREVFHKSRRLNPMPPFPDDLVAASKGQLAETPGPPVRVIKTNTLGWGYHARYIGYPDTAAP